MDDRILDWVLEETPISDVFILQYMNELEGLALRLYLLLCYSTKKREQISASTACRMLGASLADLKKALVQLSVAGVIDLSEDGEQFSWIDLRKRELESYFGLQRSEDALSDQVDHVKFLREIGRSFFGGRMSPTWYRVIEGLFQTYRFEEQVVYQLLCECSEQGALRTPAYINQVARSWSKRGILTFADLEADRERYRRSKNALTFVSAYLHRTLTEPERQVVRNWVEVLQYDEPMIQLALDRAVGVSNPTLNYFDRILKIWAQEGLKTREEILAYEEQRKARKGRRFDSKVSGTQSQLASDPSVWKQKNDEGLARWAELLGVRSEDRP